MCAFCVCTTYIQYLQPEEGIRLSETDLTNKYTLQCECWEPNKVILEKEQALLDAELFPATSSHFLK